MRVLVAGTLLAGIAGGAWGQGPLARARALYAQNQLAEAYPLFVEAARQSPGDPETQAWLAETARRTGRYDEARGAARAAVAADGCHPFALTVLGYLYQPIYGPWEPAHADSAWAYYRRAVTCDRTEGNAWIGLWVEAMRRGDVWFEREALRNLVATGFLTPSVLAYNRWVLDLLPPRALLLTAGDQDTYPALALQLVEALRPDVAVVNLSLLNLPWYVRLVSARYAVPLPLPDDELDGLQAARGLSDTVVRVWRARSLAGDLGRPLLAAATAAPWDISGPGTFQDAGPYSRLMPRLTPADTAAMRRALERVRAGDFVAPEVSPADRSPLRMVGATNRGLATNVLYVATRYASALRDAGRKDAAERVLTWADGFVRDAGLGDQQAEMVRAARR